MSYAQIKTQNTRKAKSETEQTVATESNPDTNNHVSAKTMLLTLQGRKLRPSEHPRQVAFPFGQGKI